MSGQLRVMTYNIRKGLGASGRKATLQALRDSIRLVNADVVFLQEVMGATSKKIHRKAGLDTDQLEYLADQVWDFQAYGKNAVHSEGHHGNAILSKYAFERYENLDVTNNVLERRGLLHAVIKADKHPSIDLICLHLDLLESGRKRQVQTLVERVRSVTQEHGPLLIAGDFNDWQSRLTGILSEAMGLQEVGLARNGGHFKTFPAWLPLLPLDRIYFRGLELIGCEQPSGGAWRALSDHHAIIADFRL